LIGDEATLRLFPSGSGEPLENGEIYRDLELRWRSREGARRPYVFVNAVASVDGRTAVEGRASGLGTATDRGVMRTLRSKADAVMIGGGTLRAEKLSLGLDADDPRPRPLAVVLTNTGDVPLETNLIRDRRQMVLVVIGAGTDGRVERRLGRYAEVRRAPISESGTIDLQGCLRMLRSHYGVHSLLVEGGPTLNHALISGNLVDELFVTVTPQVLGGPPTLAPTLLTGPQIPTRERPTLGLVSVHLAGDELFLRYSLARSGSGDAD
jgi:2,5-diamino-6-(ribosylamino)-4(3H)-pyrimidinone 5'-phosphate reductase